MVKDSVSQDEIRSVDNYLRGYQIYSKLLKLDRYERNYFGYKDGEDNLSVDAPLARAKMFEVRHFILELPNCDEKLLLYYRYVKKLTVERCAELLGVSRRTAYRILDRALRLAYEKGEGRVF